MKILLATLLVLLMACQAVPPRDGGTATRIQQALEPSPAEPPPPPPPEVLDTLLPPLQVNLPPARARAPGTRFDVTVNRASAREFFLSLVEGTPVNLVVHPEVAGEISLKLKDVTIEQVLETVKDVYGFDYRRSETGFQVFPATLQTRMFQVNYLNIDRRGHSATRVSSGRLEDDDGFIDDGDPAAGAGLSGSSIQTRTRADFWLELAGTLGAILGIPPQGSPLVGAFEGRAMVVSPQAGMVTVRAYPDQLREVAAFLEAANANLTRQVILEARILEVELADGYQSGINWAALGRDGMRGILAGQTGRGVTPRDQTTIDGLLDLIADTGEAFDPFGSGGLGNDPFGGMFSAALRLDDFAAFIELLSTQGNVQVLSSPRVATLNNQKAVIKVGNDEYFVTDISTDIIDNAGGGVIVNPDITLTPFFSGIALDVTPQIDSRGYVTLHIHPMVSEVTDQQKAITINDETQNLPLALSSVRETDTVIRARSGQVVVIGGLMQDETREEVAATPVLGDVPFLGALFRNTRQSARKSELVILLRPLVVSGDDAWRGALDSAGERFRELERGFHAGGAQGLSAPWGNCPATREDWRSCIWNTSG